MAKLHALETAVMRFIPDAYFREVGRREYRDGAFARCAGSVDYGDLLLDPLQELSKRGVFVRRINDAGSS